jgi:MGT family glycosyltransferase
MKIGFLSLPLAGHLNPMTALARKLKSRGHQIVFIGVPDAGSIVRAADLDFVPFCEKEYPAGSIPNAVGYLAKLHGLDTVQQSSKMQPARLKATLEHLPKTLIETGVEALVIDTLHLFAELVPMWLGIPYVHIWNILHIDGSGSTPPCFFDWPYENTTEAITRNIEGLNKFGGFLAPVREIARSYAEENGLQIDWANPAPTVSKLAVITQTPREFDLPISNLPDQFHYAGPFHDDRGREEVSFPWDKLTGDPLIYASMGTLLNGLPHVYHAILEAIRTLPGTQLVLSIGSNTDISDLGPIPSNAVLVPRAPQIELLKRTALCITHAGLNTALESLAHGVPMVAIPVGFDQPGVAARIAHHGVGEFVEVGDLTVKRLHELVEVVLNNPTYRDNARFFQRVIAERRGLDVAASVIERAFGAELRQSVQELEQARTT